MSDEWFIKTKTGKRGPYSLAQLQRYVDAGAIRPNAGICDEQQRWRAAKKIRGLTFPDAPMVPQAEAANWEKQIQEQSEQIQELQSELAKRAESLNGREQALTQRLQAAEQAAFAAADLDAKRGELERWATELDQREAEFKNKEVDSQGRLTQWEQRESELQEREATVQRREAELHDRASDLDAQVNRLETQDAERQAKAAELETKAAELETKAAELETQAAELETKTAELETKAAELDTKAAEMETEAAELETKAAELDGVARDVQGQRQQSEEQAAEQRAAVEASAQREVEASAQREAELRQTLTDLQAKWQASQDELLARTSELEELREQFDQIEIAKVDHQDAGSTQVEKDTQPSPESSDAPDTVSSLDAAKQLDEAVLAERKRLLDEFASRQESLSQRESDLMRREDELTRRELDIATMEKDLSSPVEAADSAPIFVNTDDEDDRTPTSESSEQLTVSKKQDIALDDDELQSLPPLPSEFVHVEANGSSVADHPAKSGEADRGWSATSPEEAKLDQDKNVATSWEEVFGRGRPSDEAELALQQQEAEHPDAEHPDAEQPDAEQPDAEGAMGRGLSADVPQDEGSDHAMEAVMEASDTQPKPHIALTNTSESEASVVAPPSERTAIWEYRSGVFEFRLGPIYRVDEDPDPDMRVDIEIHHPDGERDFSTLVTNGMSDYPIPMPNGQRSVHAELLLYVTHVDELALQILRTAAKTPFRKKHGLSFGTTTGSDELAALMTESQHQDCVYLFPIIESDSKSIPGRDFLSSSIQLFTLMTITDAERKLIESTGMHKFQSLLEKNNHSIYFDLTRDCYVRRKGWFRR